MGWHRGSPDCRYHQHGLNPARGDLEHSGRQVHNQRAGKSSTGKSIADQTSASLVSVRQGIVVRADFQGRPTASGESFNMYDMTCAHRSLPLGSLIRVTNLRNRKSVILRVNDRRPVAEDRIVDLSYAAANFLGVRGIAKVRLELLPAIAEFN